MDISRFALGAIANHPLTKLGHATLKGVVRSEPFQYLRNAVVDNAPIGLPEQTFIKVMTGGDKVTPGGVRLTPEQLEAIRFKRNKQDNLPDSIDYDNLPPWTDPTTEKQRLEQISKNPVTSLYDQGRDLRLTLGNATVTTNEDGTGQVYDRWDVDPPNEVLPGFLQEGGEPMKDSFDRVADLGEGGPAASLAYNLAKQLGTYEPIDINLTVPKDIWEGEGAPIEDTNGFIHNQQPYLRKLNTIYKVGKGIVNNQRGEPSPAFNKFDNATQEFTPMSNEEIMMIGREALNSKDPAVTSIHF